MLNPFSFLLARTLAQREGVDDSRANRLALMMGMTGLNPALGAVVAQQSARREVSSAQTATESAELNAAVKSLSRSVDDMQKTGESLEWLERSLVDIPPNFTTFDAEEIKAELEDSGFPHAKVVIEENASGFSDGDVIRIVVGGYTVEGGALDGFRLLPCLPFTLVVNLVKEEG